MGGREARLARQAQANKEMVYAEWLEALAVLAIFGNPDPYVPLAQRIELFLVDELLQSTLLEGGGDGGGDE